MVLPKFFQQDLNSMVLKCKPGVKYQMDAGIKLLYTFTADMDTTICACCSGLSYENCCKPFHQHRSVPATAEALMRSRYCAYALHLTDYLVETTHKSQRHLHAKKSIKEWAVANTWLKLEICDTAPNIVEFKAYYQNGLQLYIHHERSTFKFESGKWYYVSGQFFD